MIEFFDLTRQYRSIRSELEQGIGRVLRKGRYTLGPEVAAFEREMAAYSGVAHAIGVASGTDALTMSMRALNLSQNDEVIVPANAYPTVFGIALAGVRIRLTDVREDGTLDPDAVGRVITKRTRAVVGVHMYGNLYDVKRIRDVLEDRLPQKIILIEDAAQAHGAVSGRKKSGSLGDISIFSFYPTKNLGAVGDGGMVLTETYSYAKNARILRQYGESERYRSERVSGVSRLDEVQAAILRVKLRYLDEWNRKRRDIAGEYFRVLEGVGDIRFVSQMPEHGRLPSCHLFVIRSLRRDSLKEYLGKRGIGTSIHYPVPIHLTPAFAGLGYKKGAFPASESLSREVLSLPIYPELTDREIDRVCREIKRFFQGKGSLNQ